MCVVRTSECLEVNCRLSIVEFGYEAKIPLKQVAAAVVIARRCVSCAAAAGNVANVHCVGL